MYDKTTPNIIHNGEKLKAFHLRSRKRQGCSLSPLLFNIVLEVPQKSEKKKEKRNTIWKRRSKTVTADDMILSIENSKDATRKLLELINEFDKVSGNKINAQKSLALLHTNNKRAESGKNNRIYHCNIKNKIPRNKPT